MSTSVVSAKRWQLNAYGSADKLELCDVSLPPPGPGEAIVRVFATTATYTDQLIMQGYYRPAQNPPVTPGYECIGEIVAVGSDNTDLAVGARVAALPQGHCATTHLALPLSKLVRVTTAVPPVEAVNMVLTGVTAYQMLHRCSGGRLSRPGCSILVHGCTGGTGAMVVELAKIAGVQASNIYGTCSAKNLSTAQNMGIVGIDYAGQPDWSAQVLTATHGAGVDVIFDAVLLQGYLTKDFSCLKSGGKVIGYGATNASAPGTLDIPGIVLAMSRMAVQQNITSWLTGTEAEFYHIGERRDAKPKEFAEDLTTLLSMVESGQLKPLIGRVWPFEKAKDALMSIAHNAHVGKQVIKVAEPPK